MKKKILEEKLHEGLVIFEAFEFDCYSESVIPVKNV